MKIACVGGGPGGLYFAISMKRRDAAHDITVIERDPPGATYGWGVVYWDNLLDMLFRNDPESARDIRAASRLWQDQDIRRGEQLAHFPGYGYSISRGTLLDILTRRARELGVDVQHERPVQDLSEFADADLIVAADGAGSRVRQLHGDDFGTEITYGNNPYIWLGTDKVFDSFTFAFEETSAGWMWFHAYPSAADISTCIVECTAETWKAHGFDWRGPEDSTRLLEKIFENPLGGGSLISESRGEPARWLRFMQVSNEVWHHDNVVLLGDAAHTTHFTIGSGTRLAMIDSVALAQCLYEHRGLSKALRDYDRRRRSAMRPTQAGARTSMAWFEQADHYLNRQNAIDFSYAMSGRGGQQPPWRYQVHLTTQLTPVRKAQRLAATATRWYGAVRRGQLPLVPMRWLEGSHGRS